MVALPEQRRETELAGGGAPESPPRSLGTLLRRRLEAALAAAEASARRPLVALDAGCGQRTVFRGVRSRIGHLIGVDIHRPAAPDPDVDEFVVADLCAGPLPVAEGSVDVAASVFTLEHFADPPAALRTIARTLAPGGHLVLVTVNRRHPFVAAYFRLPDQLRGRLQRLIKGGVADAHPLVGACNDPAAIRSALHAAGLVVVSLDTVGHLATAWARRRAFRVLGRIGDGLAASLPSRRSTIVVVARRETDGSDEARQPVTQEPAIAPPGGKPWPTTQPSP